MYCANPDCPDFIATGSHAEFVAGVTTCPTCHEPLVDQLPRDEPPSAAPEGSPDPMADLESVLTTADPAEAEIVKSILTGADIPFLIRGYEQFKAFRGGHAAFRFNPQAGELVFLVPPERAEEARALLTETEPDE